MVQGSYVSADASESQPAQARRAHPPPSSFRLSRRATTAELSFADFEQSSEHCIDRRSTSSRFSLGRTSRRIGWLM